MDFAALPPEINSARMYSGPGSAPMLGAAAAWNNLAAEMRSTAASYGSVVSGLTGGSWLGPASTSMAAAATHHVGWLTTTATQAEQTGAQATAAAGAYESAFAATVPPPVIAANRSLLAALVATNALGQNTPAIAANEAQYAEMWAQDAAAMYGYAGASAAATQLTPFTAPQPTTNAGGAAGQAAALTQATGTSAGTATSATTLSGLSSLLGGATSSTGSSSGLAGLLSGSDNSALGTFLNGNFFSTMVVNGALAGGPFNPQFILQSMAGFSFLYAFENGGLLPGLGGLAGEIGPAAGSLWSAGLPGLGGAGSALSAVSAHLGHAASLGALSVPPSWAATGATLTPAATALPGTSFGPVSGAAGGPGWVGSPLATGGGLRRAIPKYGFRLPPVMAHPPAAG